MSTTHYTSLTVQYRALEDPESLCHTCNVLVYTTTAESTIMKFSSIPKTTFLLTLLLIATAQTFGQEYSAESKSSRNHNGDERNVSRWRNSTGVTDFNIEMRGTIELTDDDKDVKSLSNDGYLEITKTVFGAKRHSSACCAK